MVTAILFGVYAAATGIVITLISYFTGMDKTGAGMWFGWISTVALIFFLWLAMKERKQEDYGGTISYGQCLGTGVMVGVVAGIIIAIFMYIYTTSINPDFNQMIQQKQLNAWHAQGLTSEQISKAQSMAKFFTSPSMIAIWALLADVFFAFVASLIVAFFVRTKEEEMTITA
ncbi:MAG TPA: DUF4199 domain-containing protein [Candidatus Kapabacteria bacterium]|jgi:hypothetical protein